MANATFAILLGAFAEKIGVVIVGAQGVRGYAQYYALDVRNALVRGAAGAVSAIFGTRSYFALWNYTPLAEQRQVLFSNFGILVLVSQKGVEGGSAPCARATHGVGERTAGTTRGGAGHLGLTSPA